MWLIHYHAKVIPPAGGEYRFVGFADNVIVVRIDGATVLCPPHLVEQWVGELESKFAIQAAAVTAASAGRLERDLPSGESVFRAYPFTVVSLDFIKSPQRRNEFLARAQEFVIVDEAHRLNEKSGLYGNLGTNQIQELIGSAKCSIFFLDEDQRVTFKDIGEGAEIERRAQLAGATVTKLALASQFRCNGSNGYLAWLDDVLGIRPTANEHLAAGEFDFQVFDSPEALRRVIVEKNQTSNKARMVAGYCWDWKSKKNSEARDVVIPEYGFAMRWNLTKDAGLWIVAPDSVNEIGCIHTCQGLEVDYIGVIVGQDWVVRDGAPVTQPEQRSRHDKSLSGYKRLQEQNPGEAQQKADRIIKNTYRTLMTRGMKGCYVFFMDPEAARYVRSRIDGAAEDRSLPKVAEPPANYGSRPVEQG